MLIHRESLFDKLYTNSGVPHDWSIIVKKPMSRDTRTFFVHQIVLAVSSAMFSTIFQNKAFSVEHSERSTTLELEEFEWQVFENIFIKFMYYSDFTIEDGKELACTLVMSRYFQMSELENFCVDCKDHFKEEDEFSYYMTLFDHPTLCMDEETRGRTIDYVLQNFSTLHQSTDMYSFPSDLVVDLMYSNQLIVKNEDEVFHFINKYIQEKKLNDETVEKLWGAVRVNCLSPQILEKFSSIQTLSDNLVRKLFNDIVRYKTLLMTPGLKSEEDRMICARSLEWTFNPDRKHHGIILSNNNRTVGMSLPNQHASVIGTRAFTTGVHEWNVTIQGTNSHWVGIGVCEEKHLSLMNDFSHFWGCSSATQHYKTSGPLAKFLVGDIINVRLDCDRGVLNITGRGTNICASGLQKLVLYPIINLTNSANQVTISC